MTTRPEVGEVLQRLHAELAAADRTADLASLVPTDDDSPLRVALVGPFNAGKTMLIAALLEMSLQQVEALTAATPKTAEVQAYPWHSYELLDLPGTLSGLDEHDSEARRGVRLADVLVIVTTVELPGEAETAQIQALLNDDGFRGRALIVVNKMNTEQSEAAVVEDELRRRLGSENDAVPIVFTDARDLVDALTFPNLPDEDREVLREESGMAALTEHLEELLDAGEARTEALCWEAARLASDGTARWQPTAEEDGILATARRLETALVEAAEDMRSCRDTALQELVSEIRSCGSWLASTVDEKDGRVAERDEIAAQEREAAARERFARAISECIEPATRRLSEQLSAAVEPQRQYEAHLRRTAVDARHKRPQTKGDGLADKLADRIFTGLQDRAAEELKSFGRKGAHAGAPAHGAAQKINRVLGVDPKPYVHVNRAKQLTKGAKLGGKALQFLGPVIDVKGGVDDLLRSSKINGRRKEIEALYVAEAEHTEASERAATDDYLAMVLEPFRQAAAPVLESESGLQAARVDAQRALSDVRQDALELAVACRTRRVL